MAAEQIRELAVALNRTPEQMADEVVSNGLHAMRRFAYLKKLSETVDVEKVRLSLRDVGRDNPPDPGDELPDDLKYLLDRR
ncbi:MAG TPA: hypothetical protein VIJ79_18555 [Acidobacteriaceae bacterium]